MEMKVSFIRSCRTYILPVLAGIFLAGCSTEIGVIKQSPRERRFYSVADFSTGVLNGSTVNLLSNFQLTEIYFSDPEKLIVSLEQLYRKNRENAVVAALADTALQLGYQLRKDPDRGRSFFLAAAVYSCLYLKYLDPEQNLYDEQRIRLMRICNLASTELFCYLKEGDLERKGSYSLTMPGSGRSVHFTTPFYDLPLPPEKIREFSVCADFRTKNLTHDTRVFGLGVPLTARLQEGCRDPHLGIALPGMPLAVTVLTDFEYDFKEDSARGRLRYHYSRTVENVKFGTRTFPLARDFSTPLAQAASMDQKMNFLLRTLKVKRAGEFTGLYLFEPYDEKRIPVVFVHGLMSDMRTWGQMLNTLLHDPVIRKKYQFMGFAYSSGNPILVSGNILRKELAALRTKLLEKKCSTEAFDQMVLVGHSMGGLLSRLQITQCSPAAVGKLFHITDPESIRKKLSPGTAKKISELISFQPSPFIKRVIFIAVPHRGSEIARSVIGAFGAFMIELPVEIVRTNVILLRELVKTGKIQWRSSTSQTGIDNLRPDAPVLKLLNSLTMAENIPFHSIIGNREKPFTPGGSDGVVPYWSSHLDHAQSELIVRSGHSAHRIPLAIQEVRRILLKHVGMAQKHTRSGADTGK